MTAKKGRENLSRKQERKTRPATGQEEETAPDPEQPNASEASSKAADKVDAIDEVLDEFDALTLAELGFRKDEVLDSAKVDKAIKKKVDGFIQKGGQ